MAIEENIKPERRQFVTQVMGDLDKKVEMLQQMQKKEDKEEDKEAKEMSQSESGTQIKRVKLKKKSRNTMAAFKSTSREQYFQTHIKNPT